MPMTGRERVLAALRGSIPDRVPKAVGFTPGALKSFLGHGGGYLIAPSHTIEPEVPFENIEALRNAIDELGVYR